MSLSDGNWNDHRDGGLLKGSSLHVGPVFMGEVAYVSGGNGAAWRCSLNGQDMGRYPTMAGAKARIDWEVWNRLRQVREGYAVLMARKSEWEDGGNKYRSPEYLGLSA